MATIKDVSQLANVSISTVSRVINNTAQVAPEKREAVLAAMKELSFRPNSFAQALVSKRSNCIGVLVGDLCGGPFFAQMMRGIESMVDKANKFTIVVSGNHDAARERHAIQALLQRQCDALILHSKALPDEELSELVAGNTHAAKTQIQTLTFQAALQRVRKTREGAWRRKAPGQWTADSVGVLHPQARQQQHRFKAFGLHGNTSKNVCFHSTYSESPMRILSVLMVALSQRAKSSATFSRHSLVSGSANAPPAAPMAAACVS